MKSIVKSCLAAVSLTLAQAAFSAEPPVRPKITGIAYYATFVTNLEKARGFYQDFSVTRRRFHLDKPDGTVSKVVLKVNDRQFIVLVNEPNRGEGLQDHYGIATSSAEQMRIYLASTG